eukprot:s7876_g1.t3
MSLFCLARDARSKELDASDAERDAEDAGRVGCELGVGRDEYRDAEAACPGLSGPLVRFCQTHESLLSSEPERSRADLEAWEREEEVEHRKAGRAYHPISSAEVLQLLGEVPPGLSGRYSSRLRAEAQRRRASAVSEGSSGLMRRSLLLAVVFLLLQDTASHQRSLAASLAAEPSRALPFGHREIETAAEPSDAAPPVLLESVEGAGSTMRQAAGCEDVMGRAEDEAISLEVLSRRDILGYHQMLLAIHDWTSTLRRGPGAHPAVSGASGGTVLGLGEEAPERLPGLPPARRDCEGPLDPGEADATETRGLRRLPASRFARSELTQ